ncbi:homologous-pairing protein 2 homolog [Spodoptera frugiperda]|uniref:Homologous-pairing protein 2 homolog n=1 Tax=Spodoptera frugiperda TaxID=7108 RepID=A0A9R0DFP8_SPOFR|nr:homologous-pairing protein 2 homolog [Spodoptera frugiperda]
MANEAVLKYLVDTNRPYSCADVTVNLRGAFGKTAIQKALDALSEAGKIKCKLYGKQKVYAAIQTDSVREDEDVTDYDALFKSLTQDLADKTNTLKTIEISLKNLVSTPTTTAAKTQIDEIKNRTEAIEKKLEILKTSTEVISVEDKKKILGEHEKMLKEYRKRKRICSDMLDAVLEGYPKSKKNLLEELCIETDEMVGFKLMGNS